MLAERYEPDDITGDQKNPLGWAELYRNQHIPQGDRAAYRASTGGYILFTDATTGVTDCEQYNTDQVLNERWQEICDSLNPSGEPEEDDWVIETRGSWLLVRDHKFKEWDAAIAYVVARMKEDKFFPNVWHLSDHGNFRLLDLTKEWLVDVSDN